MPSCTSLRDGLTDATRTGVLRDAPDTMGSMTSLDELLTTAQGYVDNGPVPAIQLAVAVDGKLVAYESFGNATNSTRFCIFSATKPLVASAIWLLMAEGRIDVALPLSHYIDEFNQPALGAITIEQVMLHTSGFPNAPMSLAAGSDAERRRMQFSTWQLEWEPGTRFEYHAGSAHWVLADLIDRVTGLDYRDFIEQRVTGPLGLHRVLGIHDNAQDDIAELTAIDAESSNDQTLSFNSPLGRSAGVPGGGAFMTAAELAMLYQAFLHNPDNLWDDNVLSDAKSNVRCTFPDPLMGAPVNRSLGLVIAGDDGQHILRYAIFGSDCSPRAFGHAGAHAQIAWADPATGISFTCLNSAVSSDQMQGGMRSHRLATIASRLKL